LLCNGWPSIVSDFRHTKADSPPTDSGLGSVGIWAPYKHIDGLVSIPLFHDSAARVANGRAVTVTSVIVATEALLIQSPASLALNVCKDSHCSHGFLNLPPGSIATTTSRIITEAFHLSNY
jgi:hypothetical protein